MLPDPQEPPGQEVVTFAHPHILIRGGVQWSQPQPESDGEGALEPGALPPGAFIEPRWGGSQPAPGRGHGRGTGVCIHQRWRSPPPASAPDSGLGPWGPAPSRCGLSRSQDAPTLPGQAAGGWAAGQPGQEVPGAAEGSGMCAQPLAACPGHAPCREGFDRLLPNRGSPVSPLHLRPAPGHSPALPPLASGASNPGVCVGFQPNPGMCLLAARQLFLELG